MTIPSRERLIVALDVASPTEARELVNRIGDAGHFYKIGLELFMAPGFFSLLDWLRAEQKKIFVDLKFFDIPETVARAVASLSDRGADFCTVHGNQAIMEAAAKSKSGKLKVLAVTALTSLDQGDLNDLGFQCTVADLVLSRARRALAGRALLRLRPARRRDPAAAADALAAGGARRARRHRLDRRGPAPDVGRAVLQV